MPNNTENYIGILSGTSMDAIDAALVSFKNDKPQLLAKETTPIPPLIRKKLTKLTNPTANIQLFGEMDTTLGRLFAKTINTLIKKNQIARSSIVAIGSHGQTIYHHPNHTAPFTLQIGDPNIIAANTNIHTVADFRRRDLALGGQAAPLTPAFHDYIFQDRIDTQWVLNLGGIANITKLPINTNEPIIGFDAGPANTLLDQWHFKHNNHFFDCNGQWARSGTINKALLSEFLKDPYFQKKPPKSTGREYFHLNWLNQFNTSQLKPRDVQTTLSELTAITIAQSITNKNDKSTIWACGGGVFNNYLMGRIAFHCAPNTVHSTSAIGVDPKWMEAMAFAWLAKQTLAKKPGNIPSVTGAKQAAVLGAIYTA